MVRELPSWAKVAKEINGTKIYNMNVFENIMSWNQHTLDVDAFDYFGTRITYKELPDVVNEYICGFRSIGITQEDIVTLCLPVSIENMVSLLALDCMGIISNNVNYLFLKNDFDLYTRQKGSDTLITLDAYLPFFIDYIEESKIKNVIITDLYYYLPEKNKHVFDDKSKYTKKLLEIFDNPEKAKYCMEKIPTLKGVNFYRLSDILALGRQNLVPMKRGPVDIDRDMCYSYTSGTTGAPKCIVYKEYSPNAFIEMHIGTDTLDYVGERVLQVIPLTHATGERVSGYLQLAKGKTLVPQPIYSKEKFGEDLARTKCHWIVAAASFYLAGVAAGTISKDAFSMVTRPTSGGEPVTKSNVEMINQWLSDNGCTVKFGIGGGAAEDGSGTLFGYKNDPNRTNETGYPLEPYIKARLLDANGKPVKKGERGFFHVSSPAAADRYLNNEEASKKRWYLDEDGTRWGNTGDIAEQNANGSYSILGRADDSYVDKDGNTVYLFDIEYSLETSDPIIEWEITAHKTDDNYAVVAQVVLKKEYKDKKAYVVEYLCNKYHLDAVKFYDSFENSDVTGKRDQQILKAEKEGYYALYDDTHLKKVDYPEGKKPIESLVLKNEI